MLWFWFIGRLGSNVDMSFNTWCVTPLNCLKCIWSLFFASELQGLSITCTLYNSIFAYKKKLKIIYIISKRTVTLIFLEVTLYQIKFIKKIEVKNY
jgi:hypothetical protein